MSKTHKKQHYVNSSYLKAWCDINTPEKHTPYVWVFSKDGSAVRNKSPEKIFRETDFYTIKGPNGERDLTLEKGLSQLEGEFVKVRREKLEVGKALMKHDRKMLIAFVAAMWARTKSAKEHWRAQFSPILQKAKAIEEAYSIKVEGTRNIKHVVQYPIQNLLPTLSQTFYEVLSSMRSIILETDDPTGFITSDDPVMMYDPNHDSRSIYGVNPASPTINIEMPISPNLALVLHRGDTEGRFTANEAILDEFNRRTRMTCSENFVARHNLTKPYWFAVHPRDFEDV